MSVDRIGDAARRFSAYHVAGHAAAAIVLHVPVVEIVLEPVVDTLGQPGPRVHYGLAPALLIDPGERLARARDLMICIYAGFAARCLVQPNAGREHARDDDDLAFSSSRAYGVMPSGIEHPGDAVHAAFLDRIRGEAIRLVRQVSQEVATVAAELLRRPRLSGAELRSVWRRHADGQPTLPTPASAAGAASSTPSAAATARQRPRCARCGRLAKLGSSFCAYHARPARAGQ